MRDSVEALGEVVGEVLERIVRERLARRPGGHLVEAEVRKAELSLRLSLTNGNREAFTRRLIGEIDQLIDDALQGLALFRPGHAFCHRCDGAVCVHSSPSSPRHVSTGYAPAGTPRWSDFAQFCLELQHPDVDRLYADPPAFLTVVQHRGELYRGLPQVFDRSPYRLMGQVVAGFFPIRARAEEGRGVLALTVQAAAFRTRRGGSRLGLNLLGVAPGGRGLDSLWEREEDLPWRASVRWAQNALATLPGARRGQPLESLEPRVAGILAGLARRLVRDQRSRTRRTRHAQNRHASGKRPTRMALEDARRARQDTTFVDEQRGTLVVLGDRGRTHFFTPGGKLVSSVRYSREAIARKIKIERWRPAASADLQGLRRHLPDHPSEEGDR